jgi:hypothetical protein
MKRKIKIKPIYECRCNGRLQTKRFTRLSHTGLVVELEHLKIKTRLTNEKLLFITRVKRELKRVYRNGCRYNERLNAETGGSKTFVYYESIQWELKIQSIYECRCDERLQTKTRELTRLAYTGLAVNASHRSWIRAVVYYESIKRELKIRCIYESRCDERLQTKTKEFTRLTHT